VFNKHKVQDKVPKADFAKFLSEIEQIL